LLSKARQVQGLQGISIPLNSQQQVNLSDDMIEYFQFLLSHSGAPFDNVLNTKLINRQKECLHYLSRGMSAKKIGLVLKLSPKTIENHIALLERKLFCANRNDLVEKAFELGLN